MTARTFALRSTVLTLGLSVTSLLPACAPEAATPTLEVAVDVGDASDDLALNVDPADDSASTDGTSDTRLRMSFGVVTLPAGADADRDELESRAGNATTVTTADGVPFELAAMLGDWHEVYEDLKGTDADVEPSTAEGFAAAVLDDGDGRCEYVSGKDGVVLFQSRPIPEDGDCAGYAEVAPRLASLDEVDIDVSAAVANVAWGTYVGTYNGVNAYSNGSTSYSYGGYDTWGIPYQCVHYVNRYDAVYKGKTNMIHTGNANSYCTGRPVGYTVYSNGGTTKPATGDILVSKGGTYGHVAIVRETDGATYVKVIQQNWSNTTSDNSKTLTMSVSGSKYTVSAFSASYTISCWVR